MENKHVLALLGIGALVVLVMLMRRGAARGAAVEAGAPDAGLSSYPNVQPIKLGDFSVGAAPSYLTINNGARLPTVQLGSGEADGCPCGDGCATAATLVTKQVVSPDVFMQAASQFSQYQQQLMNSTAALPTPINSEQEGAAVA